MITGKAIPVKGVNTCPLCGEWKCLQARLCWDCSLAMKRFKVEQVPVERDEVREAMNRIVASCRGTIS